MTVAAALSALALTGFCLALAHSDWRRFRLPDRLTLALGGSGLLSSAVLDLSAIPDRLIGSVLGFASFDLIARLYRRVRRREGLGMGDAKLMAAAGTWVGWQGLGSVVFLGSLTALAGTLLIAKLRGRNLDATLRVPLGAYLCIGLWITWVLGPLTI